MQGINKNEFTYWPILTNNDENVITLAWLRLLEWLTKNQPWIVEKSQNIINNIKPAFIIIIKKTTKNTQTK